MVINDINRPDSIHAFVMRTICDKGASRLRTELATARHRRARRGSTITELIVAGALLVALMGAFAPLSVSAGRLWQQTRHHQLALDELSNQLDRLCVLSRERRTEELANLVPSEAIQAAMLEAKLSATEVNDDDGARIIMELDWHRIGPAKPITLTGWIPEIDHE